MKTEIEIWAVEKGQLKEIKLDEEIFCIKKKLETKAYIPPLLVVEEPKKPVKKVDKRNKRERTIEFHRKQGFHYVGGLFQGMRIIKEALGLVSVESPQKQRIKILKAFYPYAKEGTLKAYASIYKRYLLEQKHAEKRQKPPSEDHAFSRTYGVWVSPQETREVRRCIGMTKHGYRPSVKAISGETGMKEARVRAVIDALMRKGDIYKKNKKGIPVYYFVNTN